MERLYKGAQRAHELVHRGQCLRTSMLGVGTFPGTVHLAIWAQRSSSYQHEGNQLSSNYQSFDSRKFRPHDVMVSHLPVKGEGNE
jgi:hypothetical protein